MAIETEDLMDWATGHAVEVRRLYLARRLFQATGGVVQHGPLSGYNVGARATWRAADDSAKILGLYEQEVCALLARLAGERTTLIDLGAADGYYGVGLVAVGVYARSHCFEIVEESRQNLAALAADHGVGDRVHIHGAATPGFMAELAAQGVEASDSVVLCDIESSEFEVLDEACLQSLTRAHLIVEIHDFMRGDGKAQYARLLERASRLFEVTEIRTGARDLSQIPLVSDHWTDNDRWLLCSESRAKLMSWLHLAPRS
ncbi:MAG: hypothetical protein KGL69_12815 [Alphaproteobacteria bacterium]|jgi:hypothetical protein|nr:hypothetical protein [Alphaproteobacteria bacterium]